MLQIQLLLLPIAIFYQIKSSSSLSLSSSTYIWSEGQGGIFCLREDRFQPGQLIACSGNALVSFDTTSKTFITIVGKSEESGYFEDKGDEARFWSIRDVVQVDGSKLIISDMLNNCIRQLDLLEDAWHTTVLAGRCERQGSKDGLFNNSRFGFPNGLLLQQKNLLFVTEFNENQIRLLNIVSQQVTTIIESITGPFYMVCVPPSCDQFQVSYHHGLKEIDPILESTSVLIEGEGRKTGDLKTTQVNSPTHLLYLTDDLVLLVESGNGRILALDLLNNVSSSILDLDNVFSIACYQGVLYVGLSDQRIYKYTLIDLPEESWCTPILTTAGPTSPLATDQPSQPIPTEPSTSMRFISQKPPTGVGTTVFSHLTTILAPPLIIYLVY